jgi:hypothetical protein
MLEKSMCSRLIQQLSINNVLATEQCGFRKDRSTEHAAYTLINRFLQVWNVKLQVYGIFCDLAKACDWISTWIALGPLLFITYVNDLTRHISCFTNVVLFADDSSILITENNYGDLNQNIMFTLNCTSRCFKANQLVLN